MPTATTTACTTRSASSSAAPARCAEPMRRRSAVLRAPSPARTTATTVVTATSGVLTGGGRGDGSAPAHPACHRESDSAVDGRHVRVPVPGGGAGRRGLVQRLQVRGGQLDVGGRGVLLQVP